MEDGNKTKMQLIQELAEMRQRMAELEAEETGEKYRQVFATVPDAIMIFDAITLRFVEVNDATLHLYGYTREEFLQLRHADITNEPTASTASIKRTLAGELTHIPVRYHRKRDGTVFPVEISGSATMLNNRKMVCGVIRDITERLQVEEQLRESEGRLKILFEYAPDGYFLNDLKGTFLDGNKAAEEIVGYKREELIGQSFLKLKLLPTAQIPRAAKALASNALGKPSGPDEFTLNRKDGTQRLVEIRTYPVKISGQSVVLGIARDITERKQLEEQLHQSQKMEAVGQLTAGIAHNFNNMLMGIMGNLDLALLEATASQKQRLLAADRYALRGAEMVGQLMGFSYPGASAQEVVEIKSIIDDMLAICRKTFDQKIEIDVEMPCPLPTILGNATQLGHVFLNLLLNARDALAGVSGRTLNIKVELDSLSYHTEEEVPNTTALPGQYIRVRVSDNGAGMDRERRERVFEPFFTTKVVGKGTGLGLATTYAIVSQHRGWIEVESQIEVGTTFSVYLPVAQEAPVPVEAENDGIQLGGTETILLIDDDEESRNTLSSMLNHHGYTVLTGTDGRNGIEIFQHERDRIDLVLLDLVMPKMSGQEVLPRILDLDPDMKVVISTGISVYEAQLPGSTAILTKPYHAKQVLQTLRNVLGH